MPITADILQALAMLNSIGQQSNPIAMTPRTPPFVPDGGGGSLPIAPPIPLPQVPGQGPSQFEYEPTTPPSELFNFQAASQQLDPSIIEQFRALAGPAPVAPAAPKPLSTLQKIALALQGYGAGVQGQGPQFIAQLREQRERPQREYQQRLEDYNNRQTQLGLRGLEAAQSAENRRQSRAQFEADRGFEIETQNQRARQTEQARARSEQAKLQIQRQNEDRKYLQQRELEQLRQDGKLSEQAMDLATQLTEGGLDFGTAVRAANGITKGGLTPQDSAKATSAVRKRFSQLHPGQKAASGASKLSGIMVDLGNGQVLPIEKYARMSEAISNLGLDAKIVNPTASVAGGDVVNQVNSQLAPDLRATLTQTPAPALNPGQKARFADIKRETGGSDAQVIDYMRKKGWL
jgi:hypothetical protein